MAKNRNYRAKWHDYRKRCIYHITLMKNHAMPAFGRLAGDCSIPAGHPGSPYIISSLLGAAVKDALRGIGTIHPALRVYQYALMPDHLHILLSVEHDLDEILGRKIALFKHSVNLKAGLTNVFEDGFNDQILNKNRKLDVIFNYLRANPYRLAVRRQHPDFFRRCNNIMIAGTPCQAYGNIQLLDNPFKGAVSVHRADSAETFGSHKERWLYTAANGGVLVSPFISKREKEVRNAAEEVGGRLILVTNKPFGEREKPAAHDFDMCSQGRMLIIAPTEPLDFSREACLKMNALASAMAGSQAAVLTPKVHEGADVRL